MAEGETSVTIMSAADREILEKNRTNIREVLDVKDVLEHLTDKKLINTKDCKILLDNKRKAPDVVIDLLLENRTSAALQEFVVALRKARRYGTLLYVLGQESSGSDDDTDGEREDTQPQKTEKYNKNKIKKLIMKNKKLKDQLAHEKQEKEKLENLVTELVKRSSNKDKKIIELRTQKQEQEHENRIQDLEESPAEGNKIYEDNFADNGEQQGAKTQRQNKLDPNRQVFVGSARTAIQTHVHCNPEDCNNPGFCRPVSSQPYEDRSYLNNRRLPHLSRQASTSTPRTPRSAKSKQKQ